MCTTLGAVLLLLLLLPSSVSNKTAASKTAEESQLDCVKKKKNEQKEEGERTHTRRLVEVVEERNVFAFPQETSSHPPNFCSPGKPRKIFEPKWYHRWDHGTVQDNLVNILFLSNGLEKEME